MANSVPSASGFVVITHVVPQQGGQSFASPPDSSRVVATPSSLLGKFLKGEPVAMGTVQIMIGVVVSLFGIVTSIYAVTPSTFSGVMFWGAIIYITAGSLTVKANKKLNVCLVKASLGMNIISTISAGIAIILHIFDLVIPLYPFYYSYDCQYSSYSCNYAMAASKSRVLGISGVMLVLSLLEFIVSICVSAFACKATCCSGTEQVIYVSSQVQSSVSTTHVSAPALNPSEMPPLRSSVMPPAHYSVEGMKTGCPVDQPPEYTATQE